MTRHHPSFSDLKKCICGLPMEGHPPRTIPNDAPRPTSELVKRLLKHADRLEDGMFERAELPPEIELMREAAASLQSLEERNKELEGALFLCEAAYDAAPDQQAEAYLAARAALYPATKTGEK